MNATQVIDKLGGIKVTARLLNFDKTQVYRYRYAKGEHNGSGNAISPKHFKRIVRFAKKVNIDITTDDLWQMLPDDNKPLDIEFIQNG
tara:strand:- start:610 stop:873 length:264 start_codon:yes stop_codon:yes gene_type:complete